MVKSGQVKPDSTLWGLTQGLASLSVVFALGFVLKRKVLRQTQGQAHSN